MRNSAVIIYNPVAGCGQSEEISARAETRLGLAGWQVDRRATAGPEGAAPLAAEVAGNVDYLVVVGGDGSLREAIVGLGEAAPNVDIGLVPTGNSNVVARELGIPRDPHAAIENLTTGFAVPIDVAFADSELFLAMVGVGWDALVVESVGRLRKTRLGAWWYRLWADSAYFVVGFLAACKTGQPRFWISVDRTRYSERYCGAILCNFRTYSKGWSMAPEAHFQSGNIHFQGRFRSLFLFVAWQVIAALLGRRVPRFISDYGHGDTIRLESEQPFPIQVDGDFRGYATQLCVRVHPAAARIVVPRAAEGVRHPAWSTPEKARGQIEASVARAACDCAARNPVAADSGLL